jgi:uncharacterized protein
MLPRVLLAVGVLCVLSGGAASATPLEDAEAAYQSGDYYAAFERLSTLALEGNGDAEYLLGCLYQNGQGVQRNFAEAATWFIAAADRGVSAAAATLGILYSLGLGVPQDPESSADWFRRAAGEASSTMLLLPADLSQN